FELLGDAGDPGTQVRHPRTAAGQADRWTGGTAAVAGQQAVVALVDRRRAVLATGQRSARVAGQQAAATLAVEDADHTTFAAHQVGEALREDAGLQRVVLEAVDHVHDRPAGPLPR